MAFYDKLFYKQTPKYSPAMVEKSRRMLELYRDDIIKCCICPNKNIICNECVIARRIEQFELKAGISPAEI